MNEKFKAIVAHCRYGVYLQVNAHRDCYQPIEERLEHLSTCAVPEPAVQAEMIRTDTIVELQFYPRTPIGFEMVLHYDIDEALEQGLRIIQQLQEAAQK